MSITSELIPIQESDLPKITTLASSDYFRVLTSSGQSSIILKSNVLSDYLDKATYDTNDDGKVDLAENSEKLDGELPSHYATSGDLSSLFSVADHDGSGSTNTLSNSVSTDVTDLFENTNSRSVGTLFKIDVSTHKISTNSEVNVYADCELTLKLTGVTIGDILKLHLGTYDGSNFTSYLDNEILLETASYNNLNIRVNGFMQMPATETLVFKIGEMAHDSTYTVLGGSLTLTTLNI